jgi:DNA processing protein
MQEGTIDTHIPALDAMKRYPDKLFYRGDTALLKRPAVSIVGTRRPSFYTLDAIRKLAEALAARGVCIVSGAAMGVDAAAHKGAGAADTIAVVGTGIDIRYPAVNASMIKEIEEKGLVISPFEKGSPPTQWSFVVRNEIVVALGEALIVGEAELQSGTMHSVRYAQAMGKPIYVLPHRMYESSGTQMLLQRSQAEAIYDIEVFAERFGQATDANIEKDDFYYFCQKRPTLDEALAAFGDKVYEAELEGKITVRDGIVTLAPAIF